MTLLKAIQIIERIAAKQPSINTIVRQDLYRLNACPNARYGAFAWVQNQHSEAVATDLRTYRFTFFYIDRMTEDGKNEEECQSVGMETISNIMRELEECGFSVGDWTIDTFRDKLGDIVAGCYASISLRSMRGDCYEDFPTTFMGEFNEDFNEDFLVWNHKRVDIIKTI